MTQPVKPVVEYSDQDQDGVAEPISAIPVTIVGPTENEAPALSAWFGVTLQGTEAPFQVIPTDKRRHRAVIAIQGAAGQLLRLGKRNGQGAMYVAPITLVVESAAEVWCYPQAGNVITLSVIDERYNA